MPGSSNARASRASVVTPAVHRGKVYVSGGFQSKEFHAFHATSGALLGLGLRAGTPAHPFNLAAAPLYGERVSHALRAAGYTTGFVGKLHLESEDDFPEFYRGPDGFRPYPREATPGPAQAGMSRFLVDTQLLLWSVSGSRKLPARVARLFGAGQDRVAGRIAARMPWTAAGSRRSSGTCVATQARPSP